jgi:hypothetical protein
MLAEGCCYELFDYNSYYLLEWVREKVEGPKPLRY